MSAHPWTALDVVTLVCCVVFGLVPLIVALVLSFPVEDDT